MFQLKLLDCLIVVLFCGIITKVLSESSPVILKANQERNTGRHVTLESGSDESELKSLKADVLPKGLNFGDSPEKDEEHQEQTSAKKELLEQKKSTGVSYTPKKALKSRSSYPQNCKEIQKNGYNQSGVYEIFPKYAETPFLALCDMETMGGGWTHIQKRFDGSEDFYRGWKDYKFGFGDLEGEFWMGLENIYALTAFELSELLVEIVDRDAISAQAHYNSFAIGPEPEGYVLETLGGYSGDAGDSLDYHLGSRFATKDFDITNHNCSTLYLGAWWYKECHISHLNGKYINLDLPEKYMYKGLHWATFRSHEYCHAKSRMLVRPSK